MSAQNGATQMQLPKPGPGLKAVLLGLLAIWLIFALAINWGGASGSLFAALTSSLSATLDGEVWRVFTAALVHSPGDVGHILGVLVGLYFLAPSLEERWGTGRFLRFLLLAAVLSYTVQLALLWALPPSLGTKLSPPLQFGAMPVVEAVAIAWACSFSGRTVNLFFVLPVSSRGLILFVVGFSLLVLIAGQMPPSGHVALFTGMGLGWFFGAGTPSPARRLYLKYRLARLDKEAGAELDQRRRRVKKSGFRVIEGGHDEDKMIH